MIFNIVVIVGLIFQGLIIIWLVNEQVSTMSAFGGLAAYFQALIKDLGYPELMDIPDESGELKRWFEARKDRNGET